MKIKLLLLTFLIDSLSFAQQTYVPDDNFENCLETHESSSNIVAIGAPNSIGNGVANDEYVTTTNINMVTNLSVDGQSITDLTGIEDFLDLTALDCNSDQLTGLDLSQNTALTALNFYSNDISSFDASNNTNLTILYCFNNNTITSLDVRMLANLTHFNCKNTPITYFNFANGNNTNIFFFDTKYDGNLYIIDV